MFKRLILCDGCGVRIENGKEKHGVKSEVLCPYCFWDLYSDKDPEMEGLRSIIVLEEINNLK